REERLNRLDRQPAGDAPLAQRGLAPRVQRGLELVDARHLEVSELRPQTSGVDDAVALVPARQLDMRRQRSLHELRIRMRPRHAREDADVADLVEAEPAGAAGDLRDLPRLELAPLVPVELLRLGEEQRPAREVHAVAEDVGGRADLRGAGEEAVDLLAARRERHGAVQHRGLAGMVLVQVAGEPDHGATTERDDDRARPQTGDAAAADPLERSLALEE